MSVDVAVGTYFGACEDDRVLPDSGLLSNNLSLHFCLFVDEWFILIGHRTFFHMMFSNISGKIISQMIFILGWQIFYLFCEFILLFIIKFFHVVREYAFNFFYLLWSKRILVFTNGVCRDRLTIILRIERRGFIKFPFYVFVTPV